MLIDKKQRNSMNRITRLSSTMRSSIVASLAAMTLTIASTPLHAQSTFFEDWHNAQNISIEVVDNKLSVEGNNIPLQALLVEIENQTGIPITFSPDPTTRVSLNVRSESLESVIAKISDNHLIFHETNNGEKMVSGVTIISANTELEGSDLGSEFLPSGEPAPLIAAAIETDENSGVL